VGNTGPLAKLVALRILDRLAPALEAGNQGALSGTVASPETELAPF
jgi:hypothetical protein